MLYRTYRSIRYRHWCCTELTKVSGTCRRVCTGTGGTGIHVVTNLPKCLVPVLMSYRTYRIVRYRYGSRTETAVVSSTGNTGGMPQYVPYQTHPSKIVRSTVLYRNDEYDYLWLLICCSSRVDMPIRVLMQCAGVVMGLNGRTMYKYTSWGRWLAAARLEVCSGHFPLKFILDIGN